MQSHLLQIAARQLLAPFLIISIVILWRGHNLPGGGFIGGLLAAAGFILYNVAFGAHAAKQKLRIDSRTLTGIGLAVAMTSALLSTFINKPLMSSLWIKVYLPLAGEQHFGTPLLFDVGVYLVVIGVMLTIVFTLSEDA